MHKINIDVFDRELTLITERREYIKYLEKCDDEIHIAAVCGEVFEGKFGGKKKISIFIDADKLNPKGINYKVRTAAHESYHAAVLIYKSIGADLGDELEEPIAYLMDYILGKVLQKI